MFFFNSGPGCACLPNGRLHPDKRYLKSDIPKIQFYLPKGTLYLVWLTNLHFFKYIRKMKPDLFTLTMENQRFNHSKPLIFTRSALFF